MAKAPAKKRVAAKSKSGQGSSQVAGRKGKAKGPKGNTKAKTTKKKTFKKVHAKSSGKKDSKKPSLPNDKDIKKSNSEGDKTETTKKKGLKDPSLTRKEKKALVKQTKDKSGLIEKLMRHYEKLRRKDTPADKKVEIISEVLEITKGQEKSVLFKHSAVRVFEMCVKYGNANQRKSVFDLFIEFSTELTQSKYAKFLVKKLMKYGNSKQRAVVVKSFHGKVGKLIRQKEAGGVLEYVYNEYANASQRASLIEEFYGPEYAVFKASLGRSLDEIFAAEPDKKPLLLKHMKSCLVPLVQKEVIAHSLLHHALFEFFRHADGQLRSEMIEALTESVVHIVHSREGARVAMYCLWHGTTKERKVIMKSFKTFVLKICKEEFGHLVLLALFDSVDDTVLLKKIIFPEMISNLSEIAYDQYGRKVLLYLFAHRSRSYFLPEVIELLKLGDENKTSKKDPELRNTELRNGMLPHFCQLIASDCERLLCDKSASQVLLSAAQRMADSEECSLAFSAIAKFAAKPFTAENEDHAIGHACSHWVIRKLISQDKERLDRGCSILFSRILVDSVTTGNLADWALVNRGCFVLVSLLESGLNDVVKRVKDDLAFAKATINSSGSKGADILSKLLAAH